MVNLHFSLLPRWRGAAPVERAILAGDDAHRRRPDGGRGGPRHRRHLPAGRGRRSVPTRRSTSCATGWWTRAPGSWSTALGERARRRRRPQVGEPTYAAKLTRRGAPPRLDRPARRRPPPGAPRRRVDDAPRQAAQGLAHRTCRPTGDGPWCRRATAPVELVEVQPEGKAPDAGRGVGERRPLAHRRRRSARDASPPAHARRSMPSTASSATAPTPTSCCPSCSSRSGLEARDRHFATELVYGTTRMRRACDFLVDRFLTRELDLRVRNALRLGAYQLHFLRMPPHAAVGETVEVAPEARARPGQRGAAPGRRRRRSTWPDDATRLSYPDWIVERLVADLGRGRRDRAPSR